VTVAVIAGALASKPHNGGEAWVRLSWVLGMRRLGFDVWLVEEVPREVSASDRNWFESVVECFGLGERCALIGPKGRSLAGVPADALSEAIATAELLVNISGNLTCERLLGLPDRRVYLDLDPGYTQFWHLARALGPAFERHEAFLTVALAIGRPSCSIPTGGVVWHPVPPPVVLDDWPVTREPSERRMTTVAGWRGGYGRVEHNGHTFGQKAHEFRRLAAVPQGLDAPCEIALDIHPEDQKDADILKARGWRLADPREVAGDPDAFRRYVQASSAELSPAQGIYVETGSGWFSDRTTRYLASGRPAVVQETGLPPGIPRGEGLLTFRTPEEAAAAARDVLDNYATHARAARRVAEEHFASDLVLGSVLELVLT
jgi:hypothetical protein